MSWLEFLGESWAVTADDAQLHLHLWPPHSQCPRRNWTLSLNHMEILQENGARVFQRSFSVDLQDLCFHESDWRRLSGMEIRADAAWHSRQEHFGEYGNCNTGVVEAGLMLSAQTSGEGKVQHDLWLGHDFILRLGERDGFHFTCELDAWLLPKNEYHRTVPETTVEVARFAEGPPDLRIITRAFFGSGTVHVPRSNDPIPIARQYLQEEIALAQIHEPHIEWALRQKIDGKDYERMPGWTSTVSFRTQPTPPQASSPLPLSGL